jgi:hypothetical protein
MRCGQDMLKRDAGKTCQWKRQPEHVSESGRHNMSMGEAVRTCQWEKKAEHDRWWMHAGYAIGSGRQDMSVRTCQWERQEGLVNGRGRRCRQNSCTWTNRHDIQYSSDS